MKKSNRHGKQKQEFNCKVCDGPLKMKSLCKNGRIRCKAYCSQCGIEARHIKDLKK